MDFIYSLLNGGSINSKILDSNEEDEDEIEADENTFSLESRQEITTDQTPLKQSEETVDNNFNE